MVENLVTHPHPVWDLVWGSPTGMVLEVSTW